MFIVHIPSKWQIRKQDKTRFIRFKCDIQPESTCFMYNYKLLTASLALAVNASAPASPVDSGSAVSGETSSSALYSPNS